MKKDFEKDFAPYEEALALKELGFNESCLAWYCKDPYGSCDLSFIKPYYENLLFCAPTFSQAFRWFREKYGLYYFEDHRCNSKTDISSITYWMGIKKLKLAPFGSEVLVGIIELGCYNTYEEAELACLRKLIEIVKQGGNNEQ